MSRYPQGAERKSTIHAGSQLPFVKSRLLSRGWHVKKVRKVADIIDATTRVWAVSRFAAFYWSFYRLFPQLEYGGWQNIPCCSLNSDNPLSYNLDCTWKPDAKYLRHLVRLFSNNIPGPKYRDFFDQESCQDKRGWADHSKLIYINILLTSHR
jgi:hypothetical protein